MLLECFLIDNEGEEIKVEPEDMKITHGTLAIIMSHTNRCIYIFKGTKVTIVQKFASARRASAMRLQHGYKIRHVEEEEGIDEEFKPILKHLGGIIEESNDVKPLESTQSIKEKEESVIKKSSEVPVTSSQKRVESIEKETTEKKKTTVKTDDSKIDMFAKLPPRIVQVVKAMIVLEPPANSTCDYVIAGNKLYMLVGDNKTDLRAAEFQLEEVSTLPEGVFSVENYFPRILLSKKKVLGVELWVKR